MNNDLGLIIKGGQVVVSSKDVAEVYSKRHADVMRDIRNTIEAVPGAQRNFAQSSYINAQNKEQPMYLMDRQGFSMLVMGFTGKQAKEFTYKYTLAFEEMAKEIQQSKKLSPIEQLKLQNEVIIDHDTRLTYLENNMTIDYGQQEELRKTTNQRVLFVLGGAESQAYRNNHLSKKVFARAWNDFKAYFQVNSYKNTARKEFEKAKKYIEGWQPQGELLRAIEDCNSQVQFNEVI